MSLVTREEYDAVKAMAAKARAAQEALEQRVAALEAKLGGSRGKAPAARQSAPASARATASRPPRRRRATGKSR
jgi:BMFP domain-containing protein YqiC